MSGNDDGIYANTDIGSAQKIISLNRYLLATNGQTLKASSMAAKAGKAVKGL